ncbi:MAG TPA: hypothetical protein VG326_05450 [Tepidisphaeraceae bacterium]|jgi:hypothetical protein|nr:hypothetical protein [Tepidisphaeraceae bacterium]
MQEATENFAGIKPEGPFAFKTSRDQPVGLHFDRFGELSPEQATELLEVRDGSRAECLIRLPGEIILAEHAGTGYFDEATKQRSGYTIRRQPLHEQTLHDGFEAEPSIDKTATKAIERSALPAPKTQWETIGVSSPEKSINPFVVAAPTPAAPAPAPRTATDPIELGQLLSKVAADKAKYESDLQSHRLKVISLKNRIEELEAEAASYQKQLHQLVELYKNSEVTNAQIRADLSRLQDGKAGLEKERQTLIAELAATRHDVAILKEKVQEQMAVEHQSGADREWLKAQKEKLENDRLSNVVVEEKLKKQKEDLEQERDRFDAQCAAVEEQKNIWKAPSPYGYDSVAASRDQSNQIMARACIFFFITIVLLVQCASYIHEALRH